MAFFFEYIPVVFAIVLAVYLFRFFYKYLRLLAPGVKTPGAPPPEEDGAAMAAVKQRFGFPKDSRGITRKDALPLALITAVYAVIAFTGLGDTTAPQTFCHFSEGGRYVEIQLEESTVISRIMYYTGLYSGSYHLQLSADGINWVSQEAMGQSHADLFKWQYATLSQESALTKYVRIIANDKLELGEVALYGENGFLIPASRLIYDEGGAALFDEQRLIPQEPSYLNSAYFDEIYHARTAYEHAVNVYPYEVSHPPLGKLIISAGIHLFGMTPFGWRFMGTLFGVIMLPFMYVFIRNLFGSTTIAACGSTIFAFDFMHFVQTRIATIDTYAVFFIILMYFYLYKYISMDHDDPRLTRFDKLAPLFSCGLFFGLGAASKWTVIYAAAGLALIWLLHWIFRGRDMLARGRRGAFFKEFGINVLWCLLFFVLIPAIIYYVSYIPYGQARGMGGAGMLFDGDYFKMVLDNQTFMFNYHSGVVAEHPYASRWYQWIFNIRPILYYLDGGDRMKSAFGAFLSPVVCWGGLLAMLSMIYQTFARRDGKAMFILIGYLSQLVPWIPIARLTFAYHYFPSAIFLVLAICHVFSTIKEKGGARWRRQVLGFTGISVLLFAGFYPVLTGVSCPRWYTDYFLRWIPKTWPF